MTFADARPLVISTDQRPDYDVIVNMVAPGSRVLDLGCGTGDLMERLVAEKQATVQGVDLHQPSVSTCISKGLSVFHGDIHEGLADLSDNTFDYIILSRTLQQVPDPDIIIHEMLRVAPHAIVSFPNFAFWRLRLHLLCAGTLPVSPALPYEWYNTPNIRLITIADFERFCQKHDLRIEEKVALYIGDGSRPHQITWATDWRGEYGMYLLGRKPTA
ncbi:MAG: methionine biosynthesis protein MetW [Armatimonadota bacterium]